MPKLGEMGQKPRPTVLSQASWPGTSTNIATSSIQGQCDMSTMPPSRGLDDGLIKWTKSLVHGSKDPQLSANSSTSQQSNTLGQSQVPRHDVGATEG